MPLVSSSFCYPPVYITQLFCEYLLSLPFAHLLVRSTDGT